jgi:hypothetical protein
MVTIKWLACFFLGIVPVFAFFTRYRADEKLAAPLVFVVLSLLWAYVLVRSLVRKIFVTTRTTSQRNEAPLKYWFMCCLTLVLYAGCAAGVFFVGR